MSSLPDGHKAALPVIDFGRFVNGSNSEQKDAARAVDKALQNDGFLYLSNHGIPQKQVDECLGWSKRFFDLPYDDKMKAPHPPGHTHHRGFSGIGRENVTQMVFDPEELAKLRETSPDVKETFESGNTTDVSQPNIWPPEELIPGFRTFMESFFKEGTGLIHNILDCLALALDLEDPHSISTAHSSSPFQLRLSHYPPVSTELLRSGVRSRIGAHSDFGSITLLFQDAVGGLEIEDPVQKGVFRPVEPRPDLVLVNIGDIMERWSNGRWKSTLHRVGLPPATRESVANGEQHLTPTRYSIPFFAAPNMDAVIDALPGCFGENNPKKWEPVTTLDYIQMRMAAIY